MAMESYVAAERIIRDAYAIPDDKDVSTQLTIWMQQQTFTGSSVVALIATALSTAEED